MREIAICKSLFHLPYLSIFTDLDQSCLMPWGNTSMLKSPVTGLALMQFPGWLDWGGEGRTTTSRRTILHHAKEKSAWTSLAFFEIKGPLLALPGLPLVSMLLLYFGSWRLQDLSSTSIFLLVSQLVGDMDISESGKAGVSCFLAPTVIN